MPSVEIKVPDIGDFDQVAVIELLVNKGDTVALEDSLITVESDKASMEIPASAAGTITQVHVKMGDKVSQGTVIATVEAAEQSQQDDAAKPADAAASAAPTEADEHAEVIVIGSGPGGYTAAFRAADLGKKVMLIERYEQIGGVCLNVGCIPSKALLHTAEVINQAKQAASHGVSFGEPKIDIDAIRANKDEVVGKLTGGLKQLAKQRKVTVVHGYGKFTSSHNIEVESDDGKKQNISFDNAIIAVGSRVSSIPFIPWEDERVIDSTGALQLKNIPKKLLVMGGGIIGLEMATVYEALGSEVSVVELSDGLMPGADKDLVRPLERKLKKQYANIYLNTMVTNIEPESKGLKVSFKGDKAPESEVFDGVLVAIGRKPNGAMIDADKAGVSVTEHGFIEADKQMRTNVDHIFAIGDVVGQPMLAHKATHEAKVAAEVIAGEKSFFDARTIPSVAYTDPEIAWMGKTEQQCKEEGIEFEKGAFPWAASGRSLSMNSGDGLTKVLFDKNTHQLIGAGIVGSHAGELIAEAVLALEMGADAHDIGLSIHPHPTLSETLNFAAEVAEGTCTDIYAPKRS